MCINLLVRHYYLSCLCLYSLSLCKNKYVSWSTTPIYSVLESIPKRRFLHRKKSSTSYRRDHSQQQKEISTLAAGEIFVSHAEKILAELGALQQAMQECGGRSTGDINIGVLSAGGQRLISHFPAFQNQYPKMGHKEKKG